MVGDGGGGVDDNDDLIRYDVGVYISMSVCLCLSIVSVFSLLIFYFPVFFFFIGLSSDLSLDLQPFVHSFVCSFER